MSQGDMRKDKSGYFSRRRPRDFDVPENGRHGGPFNSQSQYPSFPHRMAMPHNQPLNMWPSPSYHHPHLHQHNGQHIGGMHPQSGHQMFFQHRPFGTENNYPHSVRFPHQYSQQFPHPSERQHSSMFNQEPVRNGYGHRHDRRHFEDNHHGRFGFDGFHDRGIRSEQGARPKSNKFQKGKVKVYRKKRNQNNSSNISGCEKESGETYKKVEKSDNGPASSVNNGEKENASANLAVESSNEQNSVEDCSLVDQEDKDNTCEDNFMCGESGSEVSAPHDDVNGVDDLPEEEGAVGGAMVQSELESQTDAVVASLTEDLKSDSNFFDKNLIDEGAICDLDRMFQYQEFSQFNGDNSDDELSDDDLLATGRQTSDHIRLPPTRCNGDVYTNLLDNESESENGTYLYRNQHLSKRRAECGADVSKCSCQVSGNSLCSHCVSNQQFVRERREARDRQMNGSVGNHGNIDNSDDGEDTGDFIDTDLPSHNKHILSSSDEMDNLSSSSNSDHEEDNENLRLGYGRCKKSQSDFNCNDLSSIETKVQNELHSLSINDDVGNAKTCASSQSHDGTHAHSSRAAIPAFPSKRARRRRPCGSSSASENGDNSPQGSPPQQNPVRYSPMAHAYYNSAAPCLDGAAASQLPTECHQKLLENTYNSCPPGAECELPPPAPLSCFHSNVFCSCARSGPSKKTKSNQSPTREHVALTASSEVEHSPRSAKPDSASCSVTADGGTCCPPGFQLPSVNNLSACCHDALSRMPVGYSSDRPGANFSNDESNRHQKVFVKFPVEDKMDEGESHSASSCDLEDMDNFNMLGRKQDKGSDSGGSEDPLSHDSSDTVDMVLLPMEEEIEPVHHMGAGLCAGGVEDSEDCYTDMQGQLATPGSFQGAIMPHLCDEFQYLCPHENNPLQNGLPSKEFYELIKTVSTTDSYMRFFDKDGQDVQRQPLHPCDDDTSKQNSGSGGQNSKTERLKVDRVMIWNEYEAYVMQFKQIAVSACGQTAVLNVLKALKFSCEKAAVCKVIQTSLRKEDADIPEYLFSRARAGTTAEELMNGVEKLSGGAVGGRFFHFWPPRKVKLLQWLAYWMKRGAIPMATLNLQQGPHSLWQVPDSWHHQMVYGVSHQGLYLTNPLEIVSERSAMKQLCSDSVLMVRRQDIISRFRETTDLSQLLNHPDPRWRTMNVLGQVVNVLREFNMPSVPGYRLQVTSHVSIPASYKAGITLFMRKDKSAWKTLLNAPEIPVEKSEGS